MPDFIDQSNRTGHTGAADTAISVWILRQILLAIALGNMKIRGR